MSINSPSAGENDSEVGVVLFNREESDEIWDDTELIKAYDRALKLTYDKLDTESNNSMLTTANGTVSAAKSRSRTNHQSASKGQCSSSAQTEWSIGDKCYAEYSGDSMWYEAVIKSIDNDNKTCMVLYTEYEDEGAEELSLDKINYDYPTSETDDLETERNSFDQMKIEDTSTSKPVLNDRQKGGKKTRVMNLPPPPRMPPSMSGGALPSDDEALSSMLMSWYMSGYHTGYYQAVQDQKQNMKL